MKVLLNSVTVKAWVYKLNERSVEYEDSHSAADEDFISSRYFQST
jgi:hypothetical protein